MTIAQYRRRTLVVSGLGWLVLLTLVVAYISPGLVVAGRVSGRVETTTALIATTLLVFYTSLVAYFGAIFNPRRRLLLESITPDEAEERKAIARGKGLERSPWGTATLVALGSAAVTGLLLSPALRLEIIAAPAFYCLSILTPTLWAVMVTGVTAPRSLYRFLAARRRTEKLRRSYRAHLWLHHVIPYALISMSAGGLAAWCRFHNRLAVGALDFAVNVGFTTFVIAFFVAGSAVMRIRVEALSPLEITGKHPDDLPRGRWHPGYSLLLPLAASALTWAAFRLTGIGEITAGVAIFAKTITCLVVGLAVTYWAVSISHARLTRLGPEGHPYRRYAAFRVSRRRHRIRSRDLTNDG